LIGIEPSAVLGDQHSPNRSRFDGAEKENKQRQAEAAGSGLASKRQAV
jgi:hypothetical protein